MCVCVCQYMFCIYGVWCKTRFKINLKLDKIKSLIWASSVLLSFSFLFFLAGLTVLSLDFVLKECGHYPYFATIQIFSPHVWSMNMSSYTVLIYFNVSDFHLGRISRVIFFSSIKEMSQSPEISYLSAQKIQGYDV